MRVYGITVIATFKARFRNFNQNQLGIRHFKPLAVSENVNFTKGNPGFEDKIDGISICST